MGIDSGVGAAHDARAILERIVRLTCRATGANAAFVMLRDECDEGPGLRVVGHVKREPGAGGSERRAVAPLEWGGSVRGSLSAAGLPDAHGFDAADLELLEELAELETATHEEHERQAVPVAAAGVAALVTAADMRDGYTGRHAYSVESLATRVGQRLGMDAAELLQLGLAARLHDVGKIGVPDHVLNKPGPLDAGEWLLMQQHPRLGAGMIAAVPGLEEVAPLVLHHHECWDGGGYPGGLAGTEIPLASRVISACDAFEAMVTDRPYRDALPAGDALRELEAEAGRQFDPAVVAAVLLEREEGEWQRAQHVALR